MKTYTQAMLMLFVTCMLLCCSPRPYPQVIVRPASCSHDVQFAETQSLNALLEFADRMHKPVFIDFYSPWIEACTKMDQSVFTQDDVANYFNEHFISYKVNIGGPSPGPQLADMYNVTYYPTLIFLDGKGKVMKRHEGAATASELLAMGLYLHRAVEKEMVTMGSN